MTVRPDFPLVWDNTMRSAFVECPRKFAYQYLDHWKPRTVSVHLHAGKAWAEGLEKTRRAFYCDNLPPETAIQLGLVRLLEAYGDFECPPDSAKSPSRLAEAFVFYFEKYPLATDPAQPYVGPNGPMIEFSFALPIDDSLVHPTTGEPLIYSGRADMVATYAGAVTIFDDKTTTSLGTSWAQQWDMRAQFTGYTWAAREYNIPVTQVLARGISILKTKFDTANAITHREDWRIARWHMQFQRDVRRAIELWREGYWDTNEADACSAYGGCMFRQPCMSQDPQPWLEIGFSRRRWDPLTREEVELV